MTLRDQEILEALSDSPRPIEVTGEGAVADRVRSSLGTAIAPRGERPGTIVETTGDVEVLRAALARVADLGTIVLAGPSPSTAALDLHDDVHVRGITVVGVEPLSP